MATIDLRRTHTLPKDEAKRRAESIATGLKDKVELDWRKSLLSDYRRTLPDIEYKRRRDDHLESGNEGGRDS